MNPYALFVTMLAAAAIYKAFTDISVTPLMVAALLAFLIKPFLPPPE